ncbi:MAG: carbohydrate ABC transporter permease [Deltaproteobacteria bacterium]|nr:carbohydrate ABC transporter permease [Deltaproteobacteria bacterium]
MLFVFSPTLENYHHLFFKTGFLKEFWNTLIVAVFSTALVMVVSLPAAYSFSRYNTGHGHLLFITISTRMFPGAVAAIPFFFGFKALGLLDTTFGLTVLYLYFNMSFAIFRKVIFPLIKPGAAITAIFCLVFSWNEFLFAFLFTRTAARTVNIGLSTFWTATGMNWGAMAGCTAAAIIPTLAGCLVHAELHHPGIDLRCG